MTKRNNPLPGKVRERFRRPGWLRRKAYRLTLMVLDRLDPLDPQARMELLLQGLPSPPQTLWKQSRHVQTTADVVPLANDFELALKHDRSLSHFYGILFGIQQDLAQAILRGPTDERGRDLSPTFRAAYGVVEQLINIPITLRTQANMIQEQQGLPVHREGVDTPPAPDLS